MSDEPSSDEYLAEKAKLQAEQVELLVSVLDSIERQAKIIERFTEFSTDERTSTQFRVMAQQILWGVTTLKEFGADMPAVVRSAAEAVAYASGPRLVK